MGKEKEFILSVTSDLGDSVVTTGKLSDGTHAVKYFSHYEKALDYLKEQSRKFVCKPDRLPCGCPENGGCICIRM